MDGGSDHSGPVAPPIAALPKTAAVPRIVTTLAMPKPPITASPAEALRRRAEARLKRHRAKPAAPPKAVGTARESRRLLHELQVHEIELEMQNAQLQENRDRTEALLEEYTELYDFAPTGYFTLNSDGIVQRVNLVGAQLLQRNRSRLVGLSLRLFIAPKSQSAFKQFLRQVFVEPGRHTGDFELPGPESQTRTISIEAQRSPDGRECRAVAVDLTTVKRAEERVRTSEIRYRRLFEAAHDGVLLLDPGTRKITDANPFMTRLLGYTQDQLVGKELYEIGLLKDEDASRQMFTKLKRRHKVRYEDLPLEGRDGRHQEVEVVANLYDENGHSVIQCNIRDITERKNAEEILRRNEALFAALIAQAPVGVYVVNSRFRLQQVNPGALEAMGGVRTPIGRDFSEIVHQLWPQRSADKIVEQFRLTLRTGAPYKSLDFKEQRRDNGVTEYYEWQIERVTLPDGEYGVVCFFTNVTERRSAEEARRSAKEARRRLDVMTVSNEKLSQEIVRRRSIEKQLRLSEQHQRRLLHESRRMEKHLRQLSHQILQAQEAERKRISRELHDQLSQVLVSINIDLENLAQEVLGRPVDLQKKIIRTQRLVKKSVEMVHTFARDLRPAALDDLGLIPALHTFMKELATQSGLQLSLTTSAGVDHLDVRQRTALYRVAQSALTNVAQHAQASRATVTITLLPDHVLMTIQDDGRSFQVVKGFQARGSKRLGLLGMRERIEMVGGEFTVTSEPVNGTSVQARIPTGHSTRSKERPHLQKQTYPG